MSDDIEVEAIRAAYGAIKGLNRAQWTRTLNYLANRMAEDNRAAYIGNEFAGADVQPAVAYCVSGQADELYESAAEAVAETSLTMEVIPINAVATINQRFAVQIPSDDDWIVEWFDTRDDAEKYIQDMRKEATYS